MSCDLYHFNVLQALGTSLGLVEIRTLDDLPISLSRQGYTYIDNCFGDVKYKAYCEMLGLEHIVVSFQNTIKQYKFDLIKNVFLLHLKKKSLTSEFGYQLLEIVSILCARVRCPLPIPRNHDLFLSKFVNSVIINMLTEYSGTESTIQQHICNVDSTIFGPKFFVGQ